MDIFKFVKKKRDNIHVKVGACEKKSVKITLSMLNGSPKFRTDEKGHELKAHDSFF